MEGARAERGDGLIAAKVQKSDWECRCETDKEV